MICSELDNLIPSIEYFVNRKSTPSWSIEKGIISFDDLTFVYSGRATYIVNDVEYQLKRGDFIYISRGSIRQAYTHPETPMQCYAINFNWSVPQREGTALPLPVTFSTGIFTELLDLYKDFDRVWIEKSPGYMMKARAVFLLILHKLLCLKYYNNPAIVTDNRIKKIKEHILSHYNENVVLEDLAEMVGLHRIYLGALFKKHSGISIKEYVNRVRINVAENLLYTGGYTVSEAAKRCGYNDIFYFSKVFRRQKGYPPSNALKE